MDEGRLSFLECRSTARRLVEIPKLDVGDRTFIAIPVLLVHIFEELVQGFDEALEVRDRRAEPMH